MARDAAGKKAEIRGAVRDANGDVFVEPMSFCRDVIPLTIAFNIGIMRDKSAPFLFWFIAGNFALLNDAWNMLGFVFNY